MGRKQVCQLLVTLYTVESKDIVVMIVFYLSFNVFSLLLQNFVLIINKYM